MTPSEGPLKKVPTLLTGEWALRLKVSQSVVRPDYVIWDGMTYREMPVDNTLKPEVDLWGEYVLTMVRPAPEGYDYYWFAKPKTDEQKSTPYKEEYGKSRHYELPAVLRGILFGEDYEFPVSVRTGVNLNVDRARLVARENKTERTFALCRTVLKRYLSPTPFLVPQRPQFATSELEWVINGETFKLSCLHETLPLPAAGKQWSLKYTVGEVQGLPSDTRIFPATPLTDWEPIVISQDHGQREEDGLYELVEEWLIPPDRAKPTSP